MSLQPVVRYLILCEDVRREPTGQEVITLVGLISAIRASADSQYPLSHPEFCVFVQMTGCRGPGDVLVRVRQADSGLLIYQSVNHRAGLPLDPLEVTGFFFRVRHCRFPASGLYWVEFCYNQVEIARAALMLR